MQSAKWKINYYTFGWWICNFYTIIGLFYNHKLTTLFVVCCFDFFIRLSLSDNWKLHIRLNFSHLLCSAQMPSAHMKPHIRYIGLIHTIFIYKLRKSHVLELYADSIRQSEVSHQIRRVNLELLFIYTAKSGCSLKKNQTKPLWWFIENVSFPWEDQKELFALYKKKTESLCMCTSSS